MTKSSERISQSQSIFAKRISWMQMVRAVILVLAIVHIAMQIFVIAPTLFARTDRNRDVIAYWNAAQRAHNHQPLYTKYPGYGPDSLPQNYDYAPPFAAVLSPLGALPFVTFARIWLIITLLAFWIFVWGLAKLSGDGSLAQTLIWGLIAGVFPGTYLAIALGQIDPVLWMLFAWGLIGIARPALWGLAAVVKPFYIWPLLAAERRWRALIPAVAVAVILMLLGGLVCGWESYVVWLRDILPTLTQGNFKAGNVSLSFAVIRLARFLGWNYSGGPLPALAHLWLTAASIGAPLLAWRFLRRFSTQIKCAGIIVASILFAPVCWTCYLPLTLPLVAVIFRSRIQAVKVKTCLP